LDKKIKYCRETARFPYNPSLAAFNIFFYRNFIQKKNVQALYQLFERALLGGYFQKWSNLISRKAPDNLIGVVNDSHKSGCESITF
jgi:hypothetical protein